MGGYSVSAFFYLNNMKYRSFFHVDAMNDNIPKKSQVRSRGIVFSGAMKNMTSWVMIGGHVCFICALFNIVLEVLTEYGGVE